MKRGRARCSNDCTLSQRADRERSLNLHEVEIATSTGTKLPVLGLTWFKRIWSRPKKYDGSQFLIIGRVDDHQGLSRPIRKQFKIDDGGKYRVVRWLDAETFFYTTVFAFPVEKLRWLQCVRRALGFRVLSLDLHGALPSLLDSELSDASANPPAMPSRLSFATRS
jgi:hypothetical protein